MGYGIAPPVPPYAHPRPHFRTFQLIPHLGNYILIRYFHFIIDFPTNSIFSDSIIIIYGLPVKRNFWGPFFEVFCIAFFTLFCIIPAFQDTCTLQVCFQPNHSTPICCWKINLVMVNWLEELIISNMVLLATGEAPCEMKKALAIL